MGAREAQLQGYIADYREAVAGVRYRELADLQPTPYASITFGGGGTAYALWRLAELQQARAWLRASLADRRRGAFALEGVDDEASSPGAYVHGRGGLLWLRALTAGSRDVGAATAAYVRSLSRVTEVEFMAGAAGHLTGIRLLLARREDARLRRAGEAVAARIVRRLRARARRPWQAIDAVGFAHHWPGVLHALLAWQQLDSQPVPVWLASSLRALCASWSPEVTRAPEFVGSWCNGAAGTLLLWSKAFEVTGEVAYRGAAERAAAQAMAATPLGADLCCGLAGVAYALLEHARVDSSGHWRDAAIDVGMRAIDAPVFRWPNGLFRGHPGLVCLALDLLAERPAGFPTIAA